MSYLIGIELGTTRVKVGAFNIDGTLIAEETRNYPLYYERKLGKAESNPEDWWDAIKDAIKHVVKFIGKSKIEAIAVGSHGPTLVAVDKENKPVCPSILWMDRRATKEAELISSKLGKTSNDLAWFVPRALWLKNNQPEIFDHIKYLFQPLDYINYKLTGEITASLASDFIKPWDEKIISAAGIDGSLFPQYVKMGAIIGQISHAASALTALPEGIPVIAGTGGADFVEVYISCAVLHKGIICDRGGTSQGVNLCWTAPLKDNRFFQSLHPFIPNLYHIAGLMATSGKSLQWYKELFYGKEVSYDKFFEDAAKSPAGAKKLIFLPYLTGERTPWWDSKARGVLFGLSLDHEEQDIVRAILEGVGFGINHIIRLFRKLGAEPNEIRACGGQAKSPLWNQIKADITGLPVKTTQTVDSATLGLAIIAGYGVGIYDDIATAAEQLIKFGKTYEPNTGNHKLYNEMQEIYEGLYPVLKESFSRLNPVYDDF